MYVIMDLEWAERRQPFALEATQLAALRVDSEWREVASFAKPVHPSDRTNYDSKAVGYTGYRAEDYRRADCITEVLAEFKIWLREDDILLWWTPESVHMLEVFLNFTVCEPIQNKSLVIGAYVCHHLSMLGSPYAILRVIGGDASLPEHHALNDVKTTRTLLQKIQFSMDCVDGPEPSVKELPPAWMMCPDPYTLDTDTQTLHRSNCDALDRSHPLQSVFSIRKIVYRSGITPCPCCQEDFYETLKSRNREQLTSFKCQYIYAEGGTHYHIRSCLVPLTEGRIVGFSDPKTALRQGKLPFLQCHPPTWRKKKRGGELNRVPLQNHCQWPSGIQDSTVEQALREHKKALTAL